MLLDYSAWSKCNLSFSSFDFEETVSPSWVGQTVIYTLYCVYKHILRAPVQTNTVIILDFLPEPSFLQANLLVIYTSQTENKKNCAFVRCIFSIPNIGTLHIAITSSKTTFVCVFCQAEISLVAVLKITADAKK